MEKLKDALKQKSTQTQITHSERVAKETQRERWYNQTKEPPVNGYDCPLCFNKGDSLRIIVKENGGVYEQSIPCECEKYRSASYRMAISGLNNFEERLTFEHFDKLDPFQIKMYDKAVAFIRHLEHTSSWFYVGGQSGCGKTHICVALSRNLVKNGRLVKYMNWRSESVTIKRDDHTRVAELQNAQILFIDDFFKVAEDEKPTAADIRLAFEILDYRYNRHMPTIITSEWFSKNILEIDEGVGGRIIERAKGFDLAVKREDGRNWRVIE